LMMPRVFIMARFLCPAVSRPDRTEHHVHNSERTPEMRGYAAGK